LLRDRPERGLLPASPGGELARGQQTCVAMRDGDPPEEVGEGGGDHVRSGSVVGDRGRDHDAIHARQQDAPRLLDVGQDAP